ncbi:MAG: xanthine dehydrogenase family protein subunit M [Deltaproteobacteria bacterium]|jgi:carbon-monoxide dehydrogenase medium subunit|nr:xanthine dehydrogenase family protein subunit M [Deltaproteobacteria bacterium]
MSLPEFDFHAPGTVDEACRMVAEYGDKAKIFAGGTDLMLDMRRKRISPEHVISIPQIEELKTIDQAPGLLKIGACVTVSRIVKSKEIGAKWGALCAGGKALGSCLVRNLATVGGNLASARPAADMPPPLMAYGASLVLKNTSGERVVSLDDFFKGTGVTVMTPDEILTEIRIPEPPAHSGAGYFNLGIRNACDINILNVASYIALDGPGGAVKSARIVMGCVAPTHVRALAAESLLIGEKPSEALFQSAGEAAMKAATPRGSAYSRASAEYKKDMVKELTVRTLTMAYREAMGLTA